MRTWIITAGGVGKRMGGDTPKQFLMLENKPVLMHTLANLYTYDSKAEFILTLPQEHLATWEDLCVQHHFTVPHNAVAGGEERFHSVQNALIHASGDVIAVHDGVRPFVSKAILDRLFHAVSEHSAVIPVIKVKDSLRHLGSEGNNAVNRAEYVLVQTPQVFATNLLKKAYEQPFLASYTDDASVVEAFGQQVHLVAGNDENIKLTNPLDMRLAELFLQNKGND